MVGTSTSDLPVGKEGDWVSWAERSLCRWGTWVGKGWYSLSAKPPGWQLHLLSGPLYCAGCYWFLSFHWSPVAVCREAFVQRETGLLPSNRKSVSSGRGKGGDGIPHRALWWIFSVSTASVSWRKDFLQLTTLHLMTCGLWSTVGSVGPPASLHLQLHPLAILFRVPSPAASLGWPWLVAPIQLPSSATSF